MLANRSVLVLGGARSFGAELARGIEDAGAAVGVVDGQMASRAEARAAFDAAMPAGSSVDAVVDALIEPEALVAATLADTDEQSWDARGEAVLRHALWCAQAAHDRFAGRGGQLVFVTPTIGLTGGAGLVPYTTAVEGIRALAKSAARQWGAKDIAVNCVAPPVELMGGASPDVAATALGRLPDARSDVAPVIAMLLAGPFVTGTTVVVDGGRVMAP